MAEAKLSAKPVGKWVNGRCECGGIATTSVLDQLKIASEFDSSGSLFEEGPLPSSYAVAGLEFNFLRLGSSASSFIRGIRVTYAPVSESAGAQIMENSGSSLSALKVSFYSKCDFKGVSVGELGVGSHSFSLGFQSFKVPSGLAAIIEYPFDKGYYETLKKPDSSLVSMDSIVFSTWYPQNKDLRDKRQQLVDSIKRTQPNLQTIMTSVSYPRLCRQLWASAASDSPGSLSETDANLYLKAWQRIWLFPIFSCQSSTNAAFLITQFMHLLADLAWIPHWLHPAKALRQIHKFSTLATICRILLHIQMQVLVAPPSNS